MLISNQVKVLVEQERGEREAARVRRDQEEREERQRAQREDEERIKRQAEMMEQNRRRQAAATSTTRAGSNSAGSAELEPKTSPTRLSYTSAERNGLCVVCQDEDANIAIVDCG
jgi:hypothetical protein